jgi:hypothetical protein
LFEALLLVVCFVSVYFNIWYAGRVKKPFKIRRIPALEGIDEAVGRAAEMGTPVHIATGFSELQSSEAPIVSAGYAMLGYVAECCARRHVPIRYTCVYGYNIPIAQDLIKTGYIKGGAPEMYSDDMVYYTGESQMAFAGAMMGYIMREKPAANMMFGGIQYETLNSIGAGAVAGCLQIVGTSRMYYQPFAVACCDYSMIGDEIFAVVATVKGDPKEIGGIRGLDIIKGITMALIPLSITLNTIIPGLFTQLIGW